MRHLDQNQIDQTSNQSMADFQAAIAHPPAFLLALAAPLPMLNHQFPAPNPTVAQALQQPIITQHPPVTVALLLNQGVFDRVPNADQSIKNPPSQKGPGGTK